MSLYLYTFLTLDNMEHLYVCKLYVNGSTGNISSHNQLFLLRIITREKLIHVDACSFSYCHRCRVVLHVIKIAQLIHPFSYL